MTAMMIQVIVINSDLVCVNHKDLYIHAHTDLNQ